jgi:2-oxoisovalerate dehydrogenase E2 component (dihydrolipoyl transacylase)
VYVVRLPQLGMGMTDADIVEWLASEGDDVVKDAALLLIETAKAGMEIPVPVTGVLRKIFAGAGSRVEVGRPIALIADPGELMPDDLSAVTGER